MTDIEMLDNALSVIGGHRNNADNSIPFNQLMNQFNVKFSCNIGTGTLRLILEKLIEDGYIKKSDLGAEAIVLKYNGAIFIKDGGYKRQIERRDVELEKIRLDNIKREAEEIGRLEIQAENWRLQSQNHKYQYWILVATIVAGFYYVMEIVKWILGLIH